MENSNQFIITREIYKKIKGMNREQIQVFATQIYVDGINSVETANIDLDKLREDIGAIKGIGESRLNEIMDVIRKHTETDKE